VLGHQVATIDLGTLVIDVHKKRNLDQPGYNKVVINTNELADCVKGQDGDGIVTYLFLWDDAVIGLKSLGVDGKWSCVDSTPEDCCLLIKHSMYSIYFSNVCIFFLNPNDASY
jgi:hypothetical protein